MTVTLVLSKTGGSIVIYSVFLVTGRNKRVVCLTRLERRWVSLFPAFDDGEKCSERRKRESEEQPRVGPFSNGWLCHTNLAMDLEFNHPTDIYSLRPCRNTDAPDIVAIGGEHSVEVIQVVSIFLHWHKFQLGSLQLESDTACHLIASFHVGSRITAIAWSSRTVSPSSSEKWLIE